MLVAGGYNSDSYYYYDSESDPEGKDHGYYYYSSSSTDCSNSGFLSSTEILLPGYNEWTYAAALPEPVTVPASVSLHNNIYLIGEIFSVIRLFCIFSLSAGNYADYTSRGTVWEWNSEAEEWIFNGNTGDDRSFSAASLVPLSSGIMDYCSESSPYRAYRNQEDKEEKPLKKIHAMMVEAKKKKDTSA